MPSSYSTSLRLDLPTEGSYVDSWGDVVNDGITKLVDTAVAGTAAVTVTSTNHVVSYANGATDEARAAVLTLSGAPGAAFNVFVPPVSKTYIIKNSVTTYTATIYCSTVAGNTTPAGTGIAIPSGKSVFIKTDGTDFTQAISGGLTSGTSLLKGDGSTGISNATAGTDYLAPPSGTSILKANSGGALANATAGTDYLAPPSGTSILKANSGGALANAVAGTDYAPATSGTSILYGNGSGGFSNVTIGSGVSFSLGTLSATGSGSTTAAATFDNSGSGAASGTTFDGSTARTISYNTIGAPSVSGTNATGTWPISINGSAASATTATTATNATNATNATKLTTTNFTVEESGGALVIKYGATTIMSISSAGAITTVANVTAYGTP